MVGNDPTGGIGAELNIISLPARLVEPLANLKADALAILVKEHGIETILLFVIALSALEIPVRLLFVVPRAVVSAPNHEAKNIPDGQLVRADDVGENVTDATDDAALALGAGTALVRCNHGCVNDGVREAPDRGLGHCKGGFDGGAEDLFLATHNGGFVVPLEDNVGGLQFLPGGEAVCATLVEGPTAQRSRADDVSTKQE